MNRLAAAPLLAALVACGSADPSAQTGRSAEAPPPPRQSAASGSGSLDGLWEATLRFGPDVRGTLTIDRRAGRAEIAGHAAPVRVRGRAISAGLADRLGSFEGELTADGRILGSWIQPRGVRIPYPFASPVELVAAGAGRWRGEVTPLDDHMTMRLAIRTRDGETRAFLRNPERNVGMWMNVSRLVRDGDSIALHGARRGSSSEELLAAGTHDPARDALVVPIRGDTYDFRRIDSHSESGFYPRGARPQPYRHAPPPDLADGWPVGSLERAGLDRAAIERFVQLLIDMPMDSVQASDVHAFLVARHGVLVVEEYFHGFHRDEPHDLRSAAKSLTSVLVGAAIQSGAPLSASTPVHRAIHGGTFPAGLEPRQRALTVEHLLTMSPGFDCDDSDPDSPGNEDRMQEQTAEPDWWRYTLRLPMVRDPGSAAVYCSASPNLLGAVLRGATGESIPRLFHRLVAEPLGIRRYHMPLSPTGEAYLGGGIYLLPRDFLKLGQMMLDGGVWKGRRVVGQKWVQRSTSPLRDLAGIRYGYLWWIIDFPHRGRSVRAFFAGGNGGQVVMGIPELDLVVAFLGGNYGDRDRTYLPQRTFVPRHLLPALVNAR
jgi:CubicO group peptidase (beta-lactamase class C family)